MTSTSACGKGLVPFRWAWRAYLERLRGDTAAERRVLGEAIGRLGVEKMLSSDTWAGFPVTHDRAQILPR